ncbi:MAG: creatininase family protein [Alphaproteobacteria bacterium]|nr:creatininase family protein [Alphaproteobacteria bacterium]MBU0798658.1 creatininase family protein [Alphaproteobacteria bacterium]MBU0885921.1 creatininase family protein [Alphaproteobacteria bacterium]MBU1811910.1 creatininase family protein [Alphaproteobacteria bacterium]
MQLHLSTWEEVDTYLETSKGIIIPIGSTEQHGPNGLIGTDAICPEVIAKVIGDETGALVGPTISIGNAQHHLGFSGSVTLRPTTLIAVIKDYVASLARNGFERFYFLNGHGGNIATIGAAFAEIYADYSLAMPGSNRPQVRCALKNWWDTPGVQALSKELYGDKDGAHATASEVSVTQFAYPDDIKKKEMKQAGRAPRPFADADDYRMLYPDGRIGSDPTLARPEHGERLVAASARDVAEDYHKFLTMA